MRPHVRPRYGAHTLDLVGRIGAHGHDRVPREHAAREEREGGAVHWHVAVLVDMPHAEPGVLQGVLERERTPDWG
jgi:hypothetical protein